ncbi:hypothetical protein QR685DRAFT_579621 [Neurospora intermedia]|uniref:Uncharacterized protein n=1 Tax=Neurospora intermedia TaxID=5142 RepID=A0ABR3D359_NEUIN
MFGPVSESKFWNLFFLGLSALYLLPLGTSSLRRVFGLRAVQHTLQYRERSRYGAVQEAGEFNAQGCLYTYCDGSATVPSRRRSVGNAIG